MTRLTPGDANLHDKHGEHIATCPTTGGNAVRMWEDRIARHLQAHKKDHTQYGRNVDELNRILGRGCPVCGKPLLTQTSTGAQACSDPDCELAHGLERTVIS